MIMLPSYLSNSARRRVAPVSAQELNALLFPSNISGTDTSAPYVVMKFANPQNDGLPVWGAANGGVTMAWEYTPAQQTGYYVTMWWCLDNGSFGFSDNDKPYWGCHPYPTGGTSGTSHNWEVATEGGDNLNTLAGSPKAVVKDVKYTQGLRITVNGDGTKTLRFYTALPSTANGDVIQTSVGALYGESLAAINFAFLFGDSPWFASFQHERMSGKLGRMKVFNADIGETDLLAEASDMTGLQTAGGSSAIWYGKTNYETSDDLLCDYATSRTMSWANANKATLVAA